MEFRDEDEEGPTIWEVAGAVLEFAFLCLAVLIGIAWAVILW